MNYCLSVSIVSFFGLLFGCVVAVSAQPSVAHEATKMSGNVIDKLGQPLGGVLMEAYALEAVSNTVKRVTFGRTYTDDRGLYSLSLDSKVLARASFDVFKEGYRLSPTRTNSTIIMERIVIIDSEDLSRIPRMTEQELTDLVRDMLYPALFQDTDYRPVLFEWQKLTRPVLEKIRHDPYKNPRVEEVLELIDGSEKAVEAFRKRHGLEASQLVFEGDLIPWIQQATSDAGRITASSVTWARDRDGAIAKLYRRQGSGGWEELLVFRKSGAGLKLTGFWEGKRAVVD